jgi:hypothetical protein
MTLKINLLVLEIWHLRKLFLFQQNLPMNLEKNERNNHNKTLKNRNYGTTRVMQDKILIINYIIKLINSETFSACLFIIYYIAYPIGNETVQRIAREKQ